MSIKWSEDNEFLADVLTWSASDQASWFNRDDAAAQADYERIIALEQFERRKQEGFETFRPSEPETGSYDDLKRPEVLTLEAIERDRWNAVALEMPADASRELLTHIAKAAWTERDNAEGSLSVAKSGAEETYWSEHIEKAALRLDDVQARLGVTETLDQIEERHSYEYERVHGAYGVEEMPSELAARQEREYAAWPDTPAIKIEREFDTWHGVEPDKIGLIERLEHVADTALGAVAFVGDAVMNGIDYTLHAVAFVGDAVMDTLHAAAIAGEHAARAVDIALGAVIGYFVDEPRLTAAQIHETLQARGNVETIHAGEVAVVEREISAGHESRMLDMKGGQQEHDLGASMSLGGNATAEAQLSEGYEPVQERQRTRSRHM